MVESTGKTSTIPCTARHGSPTDGSYIAKVLTEIKFDDRGLVPVIAQDMESKLVLMLAYANREAIEKTAEANQAHYYSRSRKELWHKGATSGNIQHILDIRYDCDMDALLYLVSVEGPACHTNKFSCFYRSLIHPSDSAIDRIGSGLAGYNGELYEHCKK